MLDEKVAIPWLPPDRERLLEYDISRAIARVVNPTPRGHRIDERPAGLWLRAQSHDAANGPNASEPWAFVSELKKDFTVEEIPMTASKIDDDIKVLLVVHPRDITRGHPICHRPIRAARRQVAGLSGPARLFRSKARSDGAGPGRKFRAIFAADKLLKAWGLEMDINKVVADMTFAGHNPQNGAAMPTVLLLNKDGINNDDIVTSQIDNLVLPFAGAFTGKPADGLKETVLVHTSPESELVEGVTAGIAAEQIVKDFKPSGVKYALAVRLTGKFKTAFPDGPPKPAKEDKEEANDQSKEPQLKESKADGVVILVGDSDMLNDQVCVRVQNILGYQHGPARSTAI